MTTPNRIEQDVVAYLSNEDSADISNPIHSTEFAKQYGFGGALVGGVTVWGWATQTIIEALGDSWLDRGWAEFNFRQPTHPGDEVRITAHAEDSGSWSITMVNQEGVDSVLGRVGLGNAEWIDEFATPQRMTAGNAPDPKPMLTLDDAPIGEDWVPNVVDATAEFARDFAQNNQHSTDERFIGSDPSLHPAWTAGWAESLLRHNFAIPSSMHTRSRIQHLAPISAGTKVTGGAHLIAVYERRGHHFVNFDVLLCDEAGNDLARLRHWTVFRIATVAERAALS